MKNIYRKITGIIMSHFLLCWMIHSCSKKDSCNWPYPVTPGPPAPPPTFDINSITDTYESIAPFAYYTKWSVYNVHDPSIKKFGDYYYCYSTDVGFGIDVRSGIQVRKSKTLWNGLLLAGSLTTCLLWDLLI